MNARSVSDASAQSASTPSEPAVELSSRGAAFVDPLSAVQREYQLQQQQQSTPSSTRSSGVPIRFTIPISTSNASAAALALVNGSSTSESTSTQPTSQPTPSTPSTGKVIIVTKSKASTPITSPRVTAIQIPILDLQPQPRSIASPSGLRDEAASASPMTAGGSSHRTLSDSSVELMEQNEQRPLKRPSPVLLARALSATAEEVTTPTPKEDGATDANGAAAAPSHEQDEPDVPIPSDLPPTHPAASVRPPTPPSSKARRRSRSKSVRSGPSSALTSPFASGRDQFRSLVPLLPPVNPPPVATRNSLESLQENVDGITSDFFAALRAALVEVSNTKKRRSGTHATPMIEDVSDLPGATPVAQEASLSPPPSLSVVVTPTDDTTERELRKAAIRQKNAMHMRMRNASVGGNVLRSNTRTPNVNRAAVAAAANAASKEGGTPTKFGPGPGVQRSLTFNGPSSLKPPEETSLDEVKQLLRGDTPSDDTNATNAFTPNTLLTPLPTTDQHSPTRRTLSSILKPSTPLAALPTDGTGLGSPPPPNKRQLSGILRLPSKSNLGNLGSSATDLNIPPSPGIMRTSTASRVGFVVPIGEGGDNSEDSSSDSDDSDDGGTTAGRPADAPNASPKSRHIHQPSAGIPSLRIPRDDDATARQRQAIFVQHGSQLLLASVSNPGGPASQSLQAANVMVMSVSSIFTRLRLYTALSFYLAMLGIALTVINKELYYNWPDDDDVKSVITAVRSLTSFSTLALIYCLYQYYKADFQFLQLNRVYLLRSAFWNTQLIWHFVLEVLICIIHEPPYLNDDVEMSVSDAATTQSHSSFTSEPIYVRNPWSLLIALRFYLVLRLILSRYYTGGTKILGLWFNFNFSAPFAIRNMLFSQPLLTLAPVVCTLIIGCSYSLWVFEREASDRNFTFGTGVWVVMITITAVGYGDTTPATSGGRAICILAAFIGITVTAVLVAAVHQKLTLLPYEGRMVDFLDRSSTSSVLKYYASRCISRSWKYYHFRKKAIRLVARQKFNILARSHLLLHKTLMLQGIFDFQTARKQTQAYDRRYHSEQLFRSMLEGLYDKLETMTLDFNVLEEELDLSYEEQRKISAKQLEILDEVRTVSAKTSGLAKAGVERGRFSLLRTKSLPANPQAAADFLGSDTPTRTRPPSGADSGRQSAYESALSPHGDSHVVHGRHQSMRNSHQYSQVDVVADREPSVSELRRNTTIPPMGTMNGGSEADSRRGAAHLNPKRASTLGGLDLAAAAAAVAAANANGRTSAGPTGTGLSLPAAPTPSPRAHNGHNRSSQDLLGIVVDTPQPESGPPSGRLTRRASATSNVTSDLLSVVAALSPTNNPEIIPTPAGRIRFGESDFAAHRAASGLRTNRQTILIQRGKTVMDRASMVGAMASPPTPDAKLSPHFRRPSSLEALAAAQQQQQQLSPLASSSASGEERDVSPFDPRATMNHSPHSSRPNMSRTASHGGSALRQAATARAVAGVGMHLNADQFERMMGMLASVSDRLTSVEAQLADRRDDRSPRRGHHLHTHSYAHNPFATQTNFPPAPTPPPAVALRDRDRDRSEEPTHPIPSPPSTTATAVTLTVVTTTSPNATTTGNITTYEAHAT